MRGDVLNPLRHEYDVFIAPGLDARGPFNIRVNSERDVGVPAVLRRYRFGGPQHFTRRPRTARRAVHHNKRSLEPAADGERVQYVTDRARPAMAPRKARGRRLLQGACSVRLGGDHVDIRHAESPSRDRREFARGDVHASTVGRAHSKVALECIPRTIAELINSRARVVRAYEKR